MNKSDFRAKAEARLDYRRGRRLRVYIGDSPTAPEDFNSCGINYVTSEHVTLGMTMGRGTVREPTYTASITLTEPQLVDLLLIIRSQRAPLKVVK